MRGGWEEKAGRRSGRVAGEGSMRGELVGGRELRNHDGGKGVGETG